MIILADLQEVVLARAAEDREVEENDSFAAQVIFHYLFDAAIVEFFVMIARQNLDNKIFVLFCTK